MSELFGVEGKAVLVTGGSRGIGLMLAGAFAQAGARVYIAARDEARCRAAAGETGAQPIAVDLTAAGGLERVREAIQARESALDVLIHNAAMQWRAPLREHTGPNWARTLDLNLRVPFELTLELLPLLEASASPENPARVIHVGSGDGLRVPALETYAYGASKAGLHHLTRHLARRLSRRHITVNAIAPGPFETEMLAPVIEEFGDQVVESIPLKRFGAPADIAGVALMFASRAGSFITGAVLPVDGGMSTCGG